MAQVALDNYIFNEMQLILAEKRTALSAMRTGIAVFALPLSVLSVLVATSKMYNVFHVLNLLIPIFILSGGLIVLGTYLILHSIVRIRHYDSLIREIKRKHSALSESVE